MKAKLTTIIFLGFSATVFGQTVGIGSTSFTPNASSVLELRTTTAGFLMPRMTQVQRDAIVSPAEGLMIYQNNGTKGFKYYDGSVWQAFGQDNFGNHIATSNIQLNNFWLSNDGGNEGLRVDNNGNVGVATGTPTEKLQVAGKVLLDGDIYDDNGDFRFSGEDDVYITMDYNNNDSDTRAIRFGKNSMTSPTELMRISENGNVGIGTDTPDRLLNIGSATGSQILLTREDNTTIQDDLLGELLFDSTDDTSPSTSDASVVIRATASENHGNSNKGGNLSFLTKQTGTHMASAAVERMTILNNGNVGVGVSVPLAKLHTNGSVRMDVLAGGGTQMVVADNNGTLSTQAIPTGGTSLWTQGAGSNIYRAAGYVGVGTTSPAAKFEVVNSGGTGAADDISLRTFTASPSAQFVFQTARGTEASPTNIAASDDLGSLAYWGRIGGVNTQLGKIHMEYTGNGTTNESEIQVTTSGYEHMRIDEIGRVSLSSGATVSVRPPATSLHLYGNGTSGFSPAGTSTYPSPGAGPEIGFGRGGFYNGVGATIQFLDYNGYSGGLAFNVHRGVTNSGGGAFADNWPTDVIQAMTIVNNGKIGIGTADPKEKLDVEGGNVRVSSQGGTSYGLQLQNPAGTYVTSHKAGAQTSDISYTWPTAPASVNGAVLTATTGGVLSWDSFLMPTTVTSTSSTNINPASYNAGAVSGMSISSVPAGNYLVSFNADISQNGSSACQCVVRAGGTDDSSTERSFQIPSAASQFTLMGKVSLASAGTIEIRCKKTSGGSGFTIGDRLMSVQRTN